MPFCKNCAQASDTAEYDPLEQFKNLRPDGLSQDMATRKAASHGLSLNAYEQLSKLGAPVALFNIL